MTAGPFMMSNLEGLFTPFRDLEAEMNELRTMRRVSQIWHEMERRERGAWMMFGRFFDRQMDDTHGMNSSIWDSSLFSHSRPSRYDSRSHDSGYFSNHTKPESSVVVEFPDEEREIKITLEEPSVVITEVEDSPESVDHTSTSGLSRSASPIIKSSSSTSVGEEQYSCETFSDSKPSYDASSTCEEHIINVKSVNINNKTEKFEKRTKKVDFSKMEVHFEPGSGKVNIVETNEKPPSNQLFRRKRRHRTRPGSPRLHFIGHSDSESNENLSWDHYQYKDDAPVLNSITKFDRLTNDLDLSIFSLRNTLFKNTLNDFDGSTTKNVLTSTENIEKNDDNYLSPKLTSLPGDNILIDNNYDYDPSFNKQTFNVSSKLQNMIKNSAKSQINSIKTQSYRVKEINTDKFGKQKGNFENIRSQKSISSTKVSNGSTGSNLKSRNSLKRSNSRGKDSAALLINALSSDGKEGLNDDKGSIKKKLLVSKSDSFKRNSRVSRQESLKSTSSRGSVNSDRSNSKRNNLTKDSTKREMGCSRINRTPSIGRLNSSSLKKGGIYVDGNQRKGKGATTVTLISYTKVDPCSKQNEMADKELYNNITINNLENIKNNQQNTRKDSLRSYCSKESQSSTPTKFAQKKNYGFNDLLLEKDLLGNMRVLTPSRETMSNRVSKNGDCNKPNNLNSVHHVQRVSESGFKHRNISANNVKSRSVVKQDSFKRDSSKVSADYVKPSYTRIKHSQKGSDSKNFNLENVECEKAPSETHETFHHETSSLFQPIKKERTVLSSKTQGNEIKTPVAIRKNSNLLNTENSALNKPKEVCHKLSRHHAVEKNNDGRNESHRYLRSSSSKLNLASLRRSKEPLRSFEKISNGWVGQCNMSSAVSRVGKSETKWATKKVAEMKSTSKSSDNDLYRSSRVVPISSSPRFTVHQQKESVMRLSSGYPSHKRDNRLSATPSKLSSDTCKRSRNVYTPSSLSSHSSSVLGLSKRRPDSTIRSNASVTSEAIYETLNSRRKNSTLTPTKRIKHQNPCCNI